MYLVGQENKSDEEILLIKAELEKANNDLKFFHHHDICHWLSLNNCMVLTFMFILDKINVLLQQNCLDFLSTLGLRVINIKIKGRC
jgi:hypothetical protein